MTINKIRYFRDFSGGRSEIRTERYDSRFSVIPRVGEWVKLYNNPIMGVYQIIYNEAEDAVEIYLQVK